MTLRELLQEIEKMKIIVEENGDDFEKFKDLDILININGESPDLHLTAICGSYLEFGIEPVIEPRFKGV